MQIQQDVPNNSERVSNRLLMSRENFLPLAIEEPYHSNVDPLVEELVVALDEELECLHEGGNYLQKCHKI